MPDEADADSSDPGGDDGPLVYDDNYDADGNYLHDDPPVPRQQDFARDVLGRGDLESTDDTVLGYDQDLVTAIQTNGDAENVVESANAEATQRTATSPNNAATDGNWNEDDGEYWTYLLTEIMADDGVK